MLPNFYLDEIIKTALAEDIGYIDITTDLLNGGDEQTRAFFVAKSDGVVSGISVAHRVFELLDTHFRAFPLFKDGDRVKKGDAISNFEGTTSALLKGERTALNFLQHMSGISTATARCVELIKDTKAKVVDTRKTLPGLRRLQKYAVLAGGGFNHRFGLSDAVMLKDNHTDAYGGISGAVNALRQKIGHTVNIEVEVRNFDELQEALEVGVKLIMLDNMSIEQMKQAVKLTNNRAILEASGNITEENITQTAKTGVDIISIGALTHSVKAFDVSMSVNGS
ncbi:MAG: carboxylating nicotinate-nucleotide diphosphorylase [Oscillospiraceae bacterium]|nr:carboxylating nicotinate-nucleotide diphosphorylase [Oscillospiraceae bacterium]